MFYLGIGKFTCLAIGLWAQGKGSNWFSYLLSPTAPTPCSRCLGSQVARFARPFEARPVDPVRREVYRQLADQGTAASSFSGWIAPTGVLPTTPPPLDQGTEVCALHELPARSRAAGKGPPSRQLYARTS